MSFRLCVTCGSVSAIVAVLDTSGLYPKWIAVSWIVLLTVGVMIYQGLCTAMLRWHDKWEESIRQQERDPADWWKGED